MKLKTLIKNQSLKTKWMLTTGLTILISYAAICVIIFIALHTWLLAKEEENALRTVDDMTTFFSSQGVAVTIQDLQDQTGLMKAVLNQDQTVRLYQLDGTEILQINNTSPAAKLNMSFSSPDETLVHEATLDGAKAFVMHRIVQIGPRQYILQLVHPLLSFRSMMGYILTTMLIMGIGAVILAAAISYYASTVMIKPLRQLRNSMKAVKERGFESKVDFAYDSKDEIGDLLRLYKSMLHELEISFNRQQQFVSDASHELRTPVQSIEGHLSMMKRWGKEDPEVLEESLDTTLEEVARMKNIMEELLQLARKEAIAENISADTEEIVRQVANDLTFLYQSVQFDLHVIGQKRLAAISEEALSQIVRNLYENSIRYNENDPHIQTTIHYDDHNIFLEISDNGTGIPEEHLPYIFDRFYRVDHARVHVEGSTGLGLSITKSLLKKYGGEIEVHSKIGKGTVFLVRLDLKM
ncbi:HAMP domain-containing sensor histidine kinase [Lysinibacillus odysseyi]|uniref:Signal transduction histidine-protein kinase ArlS n=1 Tax=Lysinibacillus odysseyi 34hs-1 = NBRC 100172 TaxID=1220589 RepID=A0A0A3IAQ3_9BACI|nr:HAMP domain-containing histidine kinase [Lysinibacillus odysseyi]KGR81826.1 histidine kinase [Lysinibacillus odysseyi 34hs-1 = NBRC 100172]